MSEGKEKFKMDPNEIVSPKNTEKLYGNKLNQDVQDPPAAGSEVNNSALPENFSGVDQEIDQNMFPSS